MFGRKRGKPPQPQAPTHDQAKAHAQARPQGSYELAVGGVTAHVTRKKVKNINMRIKAPDGRVEVSAPYGVSDDIIQGFLQEKSIWIKRKRQQLSASPLARASEDPKELAAMRSRIERDVPPLVARWEPVIGVQAQRLAYRNMKSRWGSCNPQTGRICINIQLDRYPAACLEYVVVHELCHLLERGHGDGFKALMDEHLPDWRVRRAQLR